MYAGMQSSRAIAMHAWQLASANYIANALACRSAAKTLQTKFKIDTYSSKSTVRSSAGHVGS